MARHLKGKAEEVRLGKKNAKETLVSDVKELPSAMKESAGNARKPVRKGLKEARHGVKEI